jgi:hypothetical protein
MAILAVAAGQAMKELYADDADCWRITADNHKNILENPLLDLRHPRTILPP